MLNVEERYHLFLEKIRELKLDKNIDFSKVKYINNRTKILLIDTSKRENGEIYGEFWVTPSNFLKGRSHPDKKSLKISTKKRSKQEEIIERFKKAHKDENLDYSEVVYVNMHTKVKIIDNDLMPDGITKYGEYWQEPVVHLKGCGHPLKGKHKQIIKQSSTTEDFVLKASEIHKERKYDYSKVVYINNHTKVIIICPKHGEFLISPDNFLQNKGCPRCGNILSKAEDEISVLISRYYAIERSNRDILDGLEIDIFIPELSIGIEYNGLRWHSEKFGKDKNYHLNKLAIANKKGVKLIQIFEDEYVNNKDIVIQKLFHQLKIGNDVKNKISARKCEIRNIEKNEAELFLIKNHIQGFANSSVYLGCFYNEKLIGVMAFKKESKDNGKWELTRFATDNNLICRGVGGKLFKYFIINYQPSEVKSFADRRWTIDENDNIYVKLGFSLEKKLSPDYMYFNYNYGCERKHKFGFRKQILHKKYNLPLTMTENEMTKELGYEKIWNCGLLKYVWKKNRE